jgi:hypothetical protein
MSPDRIRTLLNTQPFEPFTIHTGDGSEVDVLSKEFVLLYPGGRTLLVVTPNFPGAHEESDFDEHTIDVFLITKVTTPIRRSKGRRKAS